MAMHTASRPFVAARTDGSSGEEEMELSDGEDSQMQLLNIVNSASTEHEDIAPNGGAEENPGLQTVALWRQHGKLGPNGKEYSALHWEILELCERLELTKEEHEARRHAVSLLEELARDIWPATQAVLFGSTATGLALPGSDIDVTLITNSRAPGALRMQKPLVREWLSAMKNRLKTRKLTSFVEAIPNAKVPILKCVLKQSGLACDIAFEAMNGPQAVPFVREQLAKMPALRPLCLVMKCFLGQRGLNEVFTGGIGSYCLLNMIIYHLQLSGAVGQAFPDLGRLLLGFLRQFSCAFNYSSDVVCIRSVPRQNKWQRGWVKDSDPELLAVEDPQAPEKDIGQASYRVSAIKLQFEIARAHLEKVLDKPGALARILELNRRREDLGCPLPGAQTGGGRKRKNPETPPKEPPKKHQKQSATAKQQKPLCPPESPPSYVTDHNLRYNSVPPGFPPAAPSRRPSKGNPLPSASSAPTGRPSASLPPGFAAPPGFGPPEGPPLRFSGPPEGSAPPRVSRREGTPLKNSPYADKGEQEKSRPSAGPVWKASPTGNGGFPKVNAALAHAEAYWSRVVCRPEQEGSREGLASGHFENGGTLAEAQREGVSPALEQQAMEPKKSSRKSAGQSGTEDSDRWQQCIDRWQVGGSESQPGDDRCHPGRFCHHMGVGGIQQDNPQPGGDKCQQSGFAKAEPAGASSDELKRPNTRLSEAMQRWNRRATEVVDLPEQSIVHAKPLDVAPPNDTKGPTIGEGNGLEAKLIGNVAISGTRKLAKKDIFASSAGRFFSEQGFNLPPSLFKMARS